MQSKNHNNPPGVLPNFCHLGTSLRAILAVEAGALFAAFAASPGFAEGLVLFAERSVLIQPAVMLTLLLLCLAGPLIRKPAYPLGMAAVFLIAVLVPTLTSALLLWLLPGSTVLTPAQTGAFSAALAGLLLIYFHLRSKALSPAVTEARLQALQARIRPHFLFNSLNAVLSLVRSDPRRAEHALEDLSELFRALMRENRELTTLQDEIELTRAYLGLEQLRLGERLAVAWHIDKMPADALIPPLIIQPLVENAIYHGIEPSREAGEVSINIYRSGDAVHIVIRNPYTENGTHHSGNKLALANIRERLELHFDLDASLKSQPMGAVYQVHITLPYTRASQPTRPLAPVHRR
jgi:Predicted signal transduction protein with a C-terminal ATPase domain